MHKVVSKHGHPLLYLPPSAEAARSVLGLYPAQTGKARLFRGGLDLALRCRLPLPLAVGVPPVLGVEEIDWRIAAVPVLGAGHYGVLAGNPHAVGRRYIYLFCDERGRPLCVGKAGFDAAARGKIEAETAFLLAHGGAVEGIPAVWGTLSTGEQTAVILPYVKGCTPDRRTRPEQVGQLLSAWVQRDETVELGEIEGWRQLSSEVGSALAGHKVRPVLYHGDFAPWNCRQTQDGSWQVIDWERGKTNGVPGWDWFHWVVQTAILVDRCTPGQIRERLEQLFAEPAFREYAELTGIAPVVREVCAGYLEHALTLLEGNAGGEDAKMAKRMLLELGGK